jgi:hypothetical protein
LFWAAFRIGEARLGDDTLLASGSRVPELVQAAVLGRGYLGQERLGGHDLLQRNAQEAS